jgi:uncharacterized membrane protein YGL010W
MISLKDQLAAYGAHHNQKTNKIIHMIGIPAIILGLMILTTWIRLDLFDRYTIAISWVLIVSALAYYFLLDKKVCGYMAILFIGTNLIITWLVDPTPTATSLIFFLVLFVGGWAIQFIGHSIEKSKPAFTDSLIQLLIAPVFILFEVAKSFGQNLGPAED